MAPENEIPYRKCERLAYKWPLIAGLSNPQRNIGHSYVHTAINYSVDQFNITLPHKVVISDPWPNSPSRNELVRV